MLFALLNFLYYLLLYSLSIAKRINVSRHNSPLLNGGTSYPTQDSWVAQLTPGMG